MLNDNNFSNNDNRNLSEVFKELKEMQYNATYATPQKKQFKLPSFKMNFNNSTKNNNTYQSTDLKLSHIVTGCSILIVAMAVLFPKNASLKESYAKVEEPTDVSEYEINRHSLNIQNIISENSDMDKVKEQVVEERDVKFETNYNNNATLPKGEEVVTQEGVLGKDNVTVVKTYENGTFVEEIILSKENLVKPIPKLIDLGTSEFLAKHKVHLGDTMYLATTTKLKESADDSSKDVAEIKESLDVKLLELPSEEWCKVSYDSIEGYLPTKVLTSAVVTPSMPEKNRIKKILDKVNIEMELNKPSGLTLADYQKIFKNLPSDTNKIFEDNAKAFYEAEKNYNINGIFLASLGIHESNWGTSQIAQDKKNLFGYGSYDSTPYESSYEFSTYAEGIDLVAKVLTKYYINPVGTKIYNNETAVATYYNGSTLAAVNQRYASDEDWHEKVFKYMEYLYNRLD